VTIPLSVTPALRDGLMILTTTSSECAALVALERGDVGVLGSIVCSVLRNETGETSPPITSVSYEGRLSVCLDAPLLTCICASLPALLMTGLAGVNMGLTSPMDNRRCGIKELCLGSRRPLASFPRPSKRSAPTGDMTGETSAALFGPAESEF
jgi:hypothetical protein